MTPKLASALRKLGRPGRWRLSRRSKASIGRMIDSLTRARRDEVAFVTRPNVPIAGNLRVVADEALQRGTHKVVIYKDGPIDASTREILERAGARVLSGFSISNMKALSRCGTIVLSHSARDAHITRRKKGRHIVNVWHGVPHKRIELLMAVENDGIGVSSSRQRLMAHNASLYDLVVAHDTTDAPIMAEAFGVDRSRIIEAGLPRLDYLDRQDLPLDLEAGAARLARTLRGRRAILYAPTFRDVGASPLGSITAETGTLLLEACNDLDAALMVRPHPYDMRAFRRLLKRVPGIVDASASRYPEAAVVLRATDVLVTDYSSIAFDFRCLDRSEVVHFSPDHDHYTTHERGFVFIEGQKHAPKPYAHWAEIVRERVFEQRLREAASKTDAVGNLTDRSTGVATNKPASRASIVWDEIDRLSRPVS